VRSPRGPYSCVSNPFTSRDIFLSALLSFSRGGGALFARALQALCGGRARDLGEDVKRLERVNEGSRTFPPPLLWKEKRGQIFEQFLSPFRVQPPSSSPSSSSSSADAAKSCTFSPSAAERRTPVGSLRQKGRKGESPPICSDFLPLLIAEEKANGRFSLSHTRWREALGRARKLLFICELTPSL